MVGLEKRERIDFITIVQLLSRKYGKENILSIIPL